MSSKSVKPTFSLHNPPQQRRPAVCDFKLPPCVECEVGFCRSVSERRPETYYPFAQISYSMDTGVRVAHDGRTRRWDGRWGIVERGTGGGGSVYAPCANRHSNPPASHDALCILDHLHAPAASAHHLLAARGGNGGQCSRGLEDCASIRACFDRRGWDREYLLWQFTTGADMGAAPAVDSGVVYFGSEDSNVYALNASTGAKLWQFATGNIVVSAPAVDNGVVYVSSVDANVYALNASTGAKLWQFTTGSGVESSPAVR